MGRSDGETVNVYDAVSRSAARHSSQSQHRNCLKRKVIKMRQKVLSFRLAPLSLANYDCP